MSDPSDRNPLSPSQKQEVESAVRPKLGISKLIYGLGMSARDALVTFTVTTAAVTAALFFGGKKLPLLEKVAKLPEWLGHQASGKLGPKSTDLKNAATVGLGVATVVSYVAHLPGLIRGPRRVAEAEHRFDNQVDLTEKLSKANTLLEEDNERLKAALAEAQSGGTMVSRLKSEPAETPSRSA